MSIANVSIVGNVVKAPQQMQFASGKTKTTVFVAVSMPYREKRGGDAADFYKVEAWGKLAELVANRLTKGNQVTALGRLSMEKWVDNKGCERVTPTIAANDIAFPQKLRFVEPNEVTEQSVQPVEQPMASVSYQDMQMPEVVTEQSAVDVSYEDTQLADLLVQERAAGDLTVPKASSDNDGVPMASSDDDDEDDDESADDDSDDFGPNSARRPAPMREKQREPA